MLTLVLLWIFLNALAAASHAAEPQFPALTGRVVDTANLLSADDERDLTAQFAALEAKSTDQVVVVTLPSLQGFEIEEFGYRLGRHWAIGQQGKDNGVLLIVAPNERKVRIEVGRGLEPLLTDALSKIIIENGILPRFRSGDFAGGIKDGARDIMAVLTGDAEELKARARRDADAFDDYVTIIIIIIWLVIFAAVMWSIIQSVRHGHVSSAGKRSKKRDSGGWTWGSGGSSGGGWSSGGGGFSGGGGGFGGGGASGGW